MEMRRLRSPLAPVFFKASIHMIQIHRPYYTSCIGRDEQSTQSYSLPARERCNTLLREYVSGSIREFRFYVFQIENPDFV